MFGIDERPQVTPEKRIRPIERYGVKLMSMGFFLDEQSPVIWRGPIVMGIVRQFLQDVDWGDSTFLVVDLPPGTGDAPLTLVQQVPLDGRRRSSRRRRTWRCSTSGAASRCSAR